MLNRTDKVDMIRTGQLMSQWSIQVNTGTPDKTCKTPLTFTINTCRTAVRWTSIFKVGFCLLREEIAKCTAGLFPFVLNVWIQTESSFTAQCSPVNVSCLRASSQLLDQLTCRRVENSYKSSLWKHNTDYSHVSNNNSRSVQTCNIHFFTSLLHTFSDAVAILVPCRLRAMQHSAPSWAGMSTGGFSVLARSTICTWPEWVPGKANRELLLLGHNTHRPEETGRKAG